MRRAAAIALGVLLALCAACGRRTGEAARSQSVASARSLVEQGRFDEAIALVGNGADAESLYLLGRAWVGKAESAPLPTPVPGTTASAAALFKPEELTALGFLERAVAERPDRSEAQLALADLLAPHAIARVTMAGDKTALAALGGPDTSVERVLRGYGDAVQADPSGTTALERLIRFATAVGRLGEADAAFQELLRRRREDSDLLLRYGDFLAGPAGRPEAALAPYAQALIWRPDDAGTRLKMAGIHLAVAAGHLARHEYASAEARLEEVRRLRIEESSAQAARARELREALREVRGR